MAVSFGGGGYDGMATSGPSMFGGDGGGTPLYNQGGGNLMAGGTKKKKKKKSLVSDYANKKRSTLKSKPVYNDVMTRRKSGGSGRRSLIAI